MKTVIITGALGFIGQYVSKIFKNNHYYVIGIGHGDSSKANLDNIGIDEWHNADVTLNSLKKIEKNADTIVHCAGGSTVGFSINNPRLDYLKTVNSTLEVLDYVKNYSSNSSLIYLSSAAVYGSKNDYPIGEKEIPNPVSPYGFHKLASESICKSYSFCFGVNVAIIRLFSIYGEGLRKQLLWEGSKKIFTSKDEVCFFGDGTETRDWLHVSDAAKLIFHLSQTEYKFLIVNGGFGRRTSVMELISILVKQFDKPNLKVRFSNVIKQGDPKYYHSNIGNALKLGWEPQINLEKGIKNYVDWYKKLVCIE